MTNPSRPATGKQKRAAQMLDIQFGEDVTVGELSSRIDAVKRTIPATNRQIEFANALGIEFDPSITSSELNKLLDAEIVKRSLAALRNNPALRLGETIMYKGSPYTIAEIDKRRWGITLIPCGRAAGCRTVRVRIISVENASCVD